MSLTPCAYPSIIPLANMVSPASGPSFGDRRFRVMLALTLGTLALLSPPAAHAQGTGLKAEFDDYRKGQEMYERGVAAHERGATQEAWSAFDSAEERFRRMLQQNPQRTDLYAPLGDMLIRRGQAPTAYILLNKQV